MFIRETVKTAKNKKYVQHQLIESVRTSAGPRQRIVLNLGAINLGREKWKDLANAIESELHKQPCLFAIDQEIKDLAHHYAKLIIQQRLNKEAEGQPNETKQQPQYETVDVDSLSTSDAKSIGAEHVALSQMNEYNLDTILESLGFDAKHISYAKMLIAGRLVHPSSEREAARWVNEDSAICELLRSNINVHDNALHRTAVLLWKQQDRIEQYLSKEARGRFSLKETIILYDLTNTYFEGTKNGSRIAKRARSKEKRNDCPLITLALTVDEEGFPKQSKVLEGNVSEPGTLKQILDELSDYTDMFRTEKTIVIDAGIATEANLEMIKERGFKYVAVSRRRSYKPDFWNDCKEKELKLSDGITKLRVKLARTNEEAYLLCHSKAKEAKEKSMLELRRKRFEEALWKINAGLKKNGTQKRYDHIIERIGRLKEKYGLGACYTIEVRHENGIATEIDFSKNPYGEAKEQRVGAYVLRTNRLDLADEEITKIHRNLTSIEDSFRSMKSHLGLRPNYHKKDESSMAHIFITVLAYHIMAAILKKLRASGLHYNWNSIREILSSHVRVTSTFNTERGDTIAIRTCTSPTLKQRDIYNKLKIIQKPLKSIKTRLPQKSCLILDK